MAEIQALIDKTDTVELVRDQLAAILVTELAEQQVLATAAAKDPRLWKLRVFSERSRPWSEFRDDVTEQLDAFPIVNVLTESVSFEDGKSNVVERQTGVGTFHVDCYGYGLSADVAAGGHTPGDLAAAHAAQRAMRLVRNILMSAHYAYLGLRGTVGRRWIRSITMLHPPLDEQAVQNIRAARLAVAVQFNEFSPQHQGEVLDLISGQVLCSETGEVLLAVDYQVGP